jgi:hypothetical protein
MNDETTDNNGQNPAPALESTPKETKKTPHSYSSLHIRESQTKYLEKYAAKADKGISEIGFIDWLEGKLNPFESERRAHAKLTLDQVEIFNDAARKAGCWVFSEERRAILDYLIELGKKSDELSDTTDKLLKNKEELLKLNAAITALTEFYDFLDELPLLGYAASIEEIEKKNKELQLRIIKLKEGFESGKASSVLKELTPAKGSALFALLSVGQKIGAGMKLIEVLESLKNKIKSAVNVEANEFQYGDYHSSEGFFVKRENSHLGAQPFRGSNLKSLFRAAALFETSEDSAKYYFTNSDGSTIDLLGQFINVQREFYDNHRTNAVVEFAATALKFVATIISLPLSLPAAIVALPFGVNVFDIIWGETETEQHRKQHSLLLANLEYRAKRAKQGIAQVMYDKCIEGDEKLSAEEYEKCKKYISENGDYKIYTVTPAEISDFRNHIIAERKRLKKEYELEKGQFFNEENTKKALDKLIYLQALSRELDGATDSIEEAAEDFNTFFGNKRLTAIYRQTLGSESNKDTNTSTDDYAFDFKTLFCDVKKTADNLVFLENLKKDTYKQIPVTSWLLGGIFASDEDKKQAEKTKQAFSMIERLQKMLVDDMRKDNNTKPFKFIEENDNEYAKEFRQRFNNAIDVVLKEPKESPLLKAFIWHYVEAGSDVFTDENHPLRLLKNRLATKNECRIFERNTVPAADNFPQEMVCKHGFVLVKNGEGTNASASLYYVDNRDGNAKASVKLIGENLTQLKIKQLEGLLKKQNIYSDAIKKIIVTALDLSKAQADLLTDNHFENLVKSIYKEVNKRIADIDVNNVIKQTIIAELANAGVSKPSRLVTNAKVEDLIDKLKDEFASAKNVSDEVSEIVKHEAAKYHSSYEISDQDLDAVSEAFKEPAMAAHNKKFIEGFGKKLEASIKTDKPQSVRFQFGGDKGYKFNINKDKYWEFNTTLEQCKTNLDNLSNDKKGLVNPSAAQKLFPGAVDRIIESKGDFSRAFVDTYVRQILQLYRKGDGPIISEAEKEVLRNVLRDVGQLTDVKNGPLHIIKKSFATSNEKQKKRIKLFVKDFIYRLQNNIETPYIWAGDKQPPYKEVSGSNKQKAYIGLLNQSLDYLNSNDKTLKELLDKNEESIMGDFGLLWTAVIRGGANESTIALISRYMDIALSRISSDRTGLTSAVDAATGGDPTLNIRRGYELLKEIVTGKKLNAIIPDEKKLLDAIVPDYRLSEHGRNPTINAIIAEYARYHLRHTVLEAAENSTNIDDYCKKEKEKETKVNGYKELLASLKMSSATDKADVNSPNHYDNLAKIAQTYLRKVFAEEPVFGFSMNDVGYVPAGQVESGVEKFDCTYQELAGQKLLVGFDVERKRAFEKNVQQYLDKFDGSTSDYALVMLIVGEYNGYDVNLVNADIDLTTPESRQKYKSTCVLRERELYYISANESEAPLLIPINDFTLLDGFIAQSKIDAKNPSLDKVYLSPEQFKSWITLKTGNGTQKNPRYIRSHQLTQWIEKRLAKLFCHAVVKLDDADLLRQFLRSETFKQNTEAKSRFNKIVWKYIHHNGYDVDSEFHWNTTTAEIIEEFTDPANKHAYRAKRVRELLKEGVNADSNLPQPYSLENETSYLSEEAVSFYLWLERNEGFNADGKDGKGELAKWFKNHLPDKNEVPIWEGDFIQHKEKWTYTTQFFATKYGTPEIKEEVAFNKLEWLLNAKYHDDEKLSQSQDYIRYLGQVKEEPIKIPRDSKFAGKKTSWIFKSEKITTEVEILFLNRLVEIRKTYADRKLAELSGTVYGKSDSDDQNDEVLRVKTEWTENDELLFVSFASKEKTLQQLRYIRVRELLESESGYFANINTAGYIKLVKNYERPMMDPKNIRDEENLDLELLFKEHTLTLSDSAEKNVKYIPWMPHVDQLISEWGTEESKNKYHLKKVEELLNELDSEIIDKYLKQLYDSRLVKENISNEDKSDLRGMFTTDEYLAKLETLLTKYAARGIWNINTHMIIGMYGSAELKQAYNRKRLREIMVEGRRLGEYDCVAGEKRGEYEMLEANNAPTRLQRNKHYIINELEDRFLPKASEGHAFHDHDSIGLLFGKSSADMNEVRGIFTQYLALQTKNVSTDGRLSEQEASAFYLATIFLNANTCGVNALNAQHLFDTFNHRLINNALAEEIFKREKDILEKIKAGNIIEAFKSYSGLKDDLTSHDQAGKKELVAQTHKILGAIEARIVEAVKEFISYKAEGEDKLKLLTKKGEKISLISDLEKDKAVWEENIQFILDYEKTHRSDFASHKLKELLANIKHAYTAQPINSRKSDDSDEIILEQTKVDHKKMINDYFFDFKKVVSRAIDERLEEGEIKNTVFSDISDLSDGKMLELFLVLHKELHTRVNKYLSPVDREREDENFQKWESQFTGLKNAIQSHEVLSGEQSKLLKRLRNSWNSIQKEDEKKEAKEKEGKEKESSPKKEKLKQYFHHLMKMKFEEKVDEYDNHSSDAAKEKYALHYFGKRKEICLKRYTWLLAHHNEIDYIESKIEELKKLVKGELLVENKKFDVNFGEYDKPSKKKEEISTISNNRRAIWFSYDKLSKVLSNIENLDKPAESVGLTDLDILNLRHGISQNAKNRLLNRIESIKQKTVLMTDLLDLITKLLNNEEVDVKSMVKNVNLDLEKAKGEAIRKKQNTERFNNYMENKDRLSEFVSLEQFTRELPDKITAYNAEEKKVHSSSEPINIIHLSGIDEAHKQKKIEAVHQAKKEANKKAFEELMKLPELVDQFTSSGQFEKDLPNIIKKYNESRYVFAFSAFTTSEVEALEKFIKGKLPAIVEKISKANNYKRIMLPLSEVNAIEELLTQDHTIKETVKKLLPKLKAGKAEKVSAINFDLLDETDIRSQIEIIKFTKITTLMNRFNDFKRKLSQPDQLVTAIDLNLAVIMLNELSNNADSASTVHSGFISDFEDNISDDINSELFAYFGYLLQNGQKEAQSLSPVVERYIAYLSIMEKLNDKANKAGKVNASEVGALIAKSTLTNSEATIGKMKEELEKVAYNFIQTVLANIEKSTDLLTELSKVENLSLFATEAQQFHINFWKEVAGGAKESIKILKNKMLTSASEDQLFEDIFRSDNPHVVQLTKDTLKLEQKLELINHLKKYYQHCKLVGVVDEIKKKRKPSSSSSSQKSPQKMAAELSKEKEDFEKVCDSIENIEKGILKDLNNKVINAQEEAKVAAKNKEAAQKEVREAAEFRDAANLMVELAHKNNNQIAAEVVEAENEVRAKSEEVLNAADLAASTTPLSYQGSMTAGIAKGAGFFGGANRSSPKKQAEDNLAKVKEKTTHAETTLTAAVDKANEAVQKLKAAIGVAEAADKRAAEAESKAMTAVEELANVAKQTTLPVVVPTLVRAVSASSSSSTTTTTTSDAKLRGMWPPVTAAKQQVQPTSAPVIETTATASTSSTSSSSNTPPRKGGSK